jgi:glucose/arabinose dehydrogenase
MRNVLMLRMILIMIILVMHSTSCADPVQSSKIKLPGNFEIEIYASGIESARAMTFADDGTLFVGSKNGSVYAITKNRDVHIIDNNLRLPIGIDFHNHDLYVSDLSKIRKYKNILSNLKQPPGPVVIYSTLPDDTHHGGKFIKFGPDNKLYINIGAPCNVCIKEDERYGTISRMGPDGGNFEIFARGVRNSVGFDWHPETNEMWFTDNGRDWMGDDSPPDELNRASAKGLHFGFPFIHGKYVKDPDYWSRKPAVDFVPAAYELQAHVASLGMRFYTGYMFPGYYKNGVFIAEHGSWNRSEKIGYRISFIKIKSNKAVSYEIFASGWLHNGKVTGRPTDVEVGPEGALYVSDDRADVIYRIYYKQ